MEVIRCPNPKCRRRILDDEGTETEWTVLEEEDRNYYRPWWQMKKKEQRNREAMELAMKVFGEEMSICEYAKTKGENRRTLAFRKDKVLEKLRYFFREHGIDV